MKIGIMDSGLGGLTVLKECLQRLPAHEYVYYADSLYAPYGNKTPAEVLRLTANVVEKLVELGAEMIVLACNTATSAAAEVLRAQYDIPIIGMEPAIKPALAAAGIKRVLVTATELTLKQPKFRNLIDTLDASLRVDYLPLTQLVNFAETGDFSRETVMPYLQEKFANICPAEYGSIVLGCTHFPLFRAYFAELFSETTTILDGTVGTTKRIQEFITYDTPTPRITFYTSGKLVTAGLQFELMQRIIMAENVEMDGA